MASLRKRTRTAYEADVAKPPSSPPKRRATRGSAVRGKENAIPIFPDNIVVQSSKKKVVVIADEDDVMDVDASSATVALKPASPSKGNVMSPGKKVNSIFKVTKNVSDNLKPVPSTPSKHNRVQILPITPRHRIPISAASRTPKTPSGRIINALAATPGTPSTPSSRSIFTTAKNLFVRSAAPGKLVGREKERDTLTSFLSTRISKKTGGCLYVSGPPGVGKSALLSEVLTDLSSEGIKTVYVNCMTTKDPKGIYSKLAEDFLGDDNLFSSANSDDVSALEAVFAPKKKSKDGAVSIVVLDEMDSLLTRDQEILYKIFEWAFAKTSKLILIGIANALDLTDRFLPRLKARNFEPVLLQVMPYTAEQIAQVVTSRLKSLLPSGEDSFVPFIHPMAITLCSKKVAQSTGDLRKCFDICRKAIDMVEHETRTKMLAEAAASTSTSDDSSSGDNTPMSITPMATPSKKAVLGDSTAGNILSPPTKQAPATTAIRCVGNPLLTLTPLTAPRATLAHIARISTTSFGITASTRLKSLNLNQKAVVCALVVLSRRTNGGGVAVKDLWARYLELCKSDGVLFPTVTRGEFGDILSGLESAGVVEMEGGVGGKGNGTTPSRKKKGAAEEKIVRATVKEDEVREVVKGEKGCEVLGKMFGRDV